MGSSFQKIILLLIVFMDVLSFSVFIPSLADVAQYYWISLAYTGLILTIYSVFAFLFLPILGQLAEKYGRKPILFLSLVWTFIWNLIIYLAPNYWLFLLWRAIDWATWANVSVIQAILSDISKNKKEKAINLGYIGAIFSISFTIWPFIWGYLLKFGVPTIFLFIVILSIITIILSFFVKETGKKRKINENLSLNPFKIIFKYLKTIPLKYLLYSFLLTLFAVQSYFLILPLILKLRYNLNWEYSWYLLGIVGFIGLLNQIILLKKFWLNFFSYKFLLFFSNLGLLILTFLMGLPVTLELFVVLFIFSSILLGVFRPIYNTEIMETTDRTAEVLWVLSSLRSIVMIFAPIFGSLLVGYWINIFFIDSLILLFSLYFVMKFLKSS